MRRTVAGLSALVIALALWAEASTASAAVPRSARAGSALVVGGQLRSSTGGYVATLYRSGDLIVHSPRGFVWSTGTRGSSPRLVVQRNGDVVLSAGGRVVWRSGTRGSGASNVLSMGSNGALVLANSSGLVWSSRLGNSCARNTASREIRVALHRQLAWMCRYSQLVKTTYVTTGATALGDGTPTGSWRIYQKTRDTYLHPASGGAYFVHYWMPYSGAYGIHDSSWQKFAYGSQKYRTAGSHGCIHLPGSTMAWFYRWAPVGTRVTITN